MKNLEIFDILNYNAIKYQHNYKNIFMKYKTYVFFNKIFRNYSF